MPAPTQPTTDLRQGRPILGHVNLMVDTFLANANVDDLRAIMRGLLSSGSPAITTAFLNSAQRRLTSPSLPIPSTSEGLFIRVTGRSGSCTIPTKELRQMLMRARTLYGAGLGFASLKTLAQPVKATVGLQWDDSALEGVLAEIDADISQALQSCREEWDSGRVQDTMAARGALEELRMAVKESERAVERWNGPFPFERAAASLEFWKL